MIRDRRGRGASGVHAARSREAEVLVHFPLVEGDRFGNRDPERTDDSRHSPLVTERARQTDAMLPRPACGISACWQPARSCSWTGS